MTKLPMQDSATYKVMNRRRFAGIMVGLTSIVAVGVWVGLDYLAQYAAQLEELTATEPLQAAATLRQHLQTLAILNVIVLTSLATLLIRHGRRGWRTASMPPKGTWILEGQRTWVGEPAVRIAKFTIVVGALLFVLAVASSLVLLNVGNTITDVSSQDIVR